MSKQKIIPIVSLVVISGLAALFFVNVPSERNELSEIFFIEGVYFESQNYVEVHFLDKSDKTNKAVLEILGMEESYQKTFDNTSEFIEIIPFESAPKYGWEIHPITLVIEHAEHGTINLKTEIHAINEPIPPVIYGKS